MPIETLLIILFARNTYSLHYLAAGSIYDFHYKLKTDDNPLSKVVTGDRKKLDSKDQWVKRYRLKVLILLSVVVAVTIFVFFDI